MVADALTSVRTESPACSREPTVAGIIAPSRSMWISPPVTVVRTGTPTEGPNSQRLVPSKLTTAAAVARNHAAAGCSRILRCALRLAILGFFPHKGSGADL